MRNRINCSGSAKLTEVHSSIVENSIEQLRVNQRWTKKGRTAVADVGKLLLRERTFISSTIHKTQRWAQETVVADVGRLLLERYHPSLVSRR